MTAAAAPPLPLRRNTTYQLLWWGRALGGIGNALTFLAFPLLAQERLGGSHAAGLTLVADQIGELATLLVAGVLADRFDRKRLLLSATLLQLVSVGTVVTLVATDRLSLPALLATVFWAGVAWSLYGTAETAAIAQVVPPTQRAEAASLNQTRSFVVGLVAAPLGGVLFAVSPKLPFVLDISLGAVLLVAILLVRGQLRVEPDADSVPRGVLAQAREGFAFLLRDTLQRRMLLALVVVNAVDPLLVLALIAITIDTLHSGKGTGVIYGVGIALGLVSSLFVRRLLRGSRPGVPAVAALWLLALCTAGMAATTRNFWVAGVCYALTFLAIPVLGSVFVGYRVARTPLLLQGRSQAASGLIVVALRPVVSLVAGFALSASVSASVAVTAVVVAVLALGLTLTPSIRRMPPAADWAAGN